MGFEVIHNSPMTLWVPLVYETTIYDGSIVSLDNSAPTEGVQTLPQAAGASNTTNKDIPLGVVIGNNLRDPVFNTTAKANYITSATPHDSTTEFVSTEGVWIKGGREHMVKIAVIDPTTVIKGPLWDSAVGTAPTVSTVTTGCSGDGIGCTTGAASVASVPVYSTIYFRTGANKGAYRVLDTTSSTTHEWDTPFYADIAVGDTCVVVNMRPFGTSRAQILLTYGTGWDIDEAVTAAYFHITVLKLDLSTANSEHVYFRFDGDNFCQARA